MARRIGHAADWRARHKVYQSAAREGDDRLTACRSTSIAPAVRSYPAP